MFTKINNISDIQPFIKDKKEIREQIQSNGITVICYMFADSKTFDSPELLECRGSAFDASGNIVSRPLHKFFNVGERENLQIENILHRNDIVAVYDKLDGSMIATAYFNNQLHFRSKKSFTSDVVKLTNEFLNLQENFHIKKFAEKIASENFTAIFELTHPLARIVVNQEIAQLRLLHVRDNITGEYVLLKEKHHIHSYINEYDIPCVKQVKFNSINDVIESLKEMKDREGYIIQFSNGDMVKLKCPWYLRMHRAITFLRERDIAILAINEELDDVKSSLLESGIDLTPVNEVETRLKNILTNYSDIIETEYKKTAHLNRKEFAIANKANPLFGLIMEKYLGKGFSLIDWYKRNKLKEDFSLKVLANDALADAFDI
jgi:RNA ligase